MAASRNTSEFTSATGANDRRKRGRGVVFLAVMVFAATFRVVDAQTLTGPFEPMNAWWLHPTQGTLGVLTDGSTISIDRDGDGIAESDYPVPTINSAPLAAPNLRLTPTRQVLYAFGDPCNSNGTMVYFYEVPAPPAPLSFLVSACIDYGIGQVGFYDTGLCAFNGIGLDCAGRLGVSPLRRAYVADQGNFATQRFQIHWFDLNNGDHTTTFPGFSTSMPLTRQIVSPYGDVAAVQHGVSTTSNYTLVDLCALPRLGSPLSSNVGGELFGLSGIPTVEMVDRGGGDYAVRVTHPDLVGGSDDFAFTPCGGTPPTETGACCALDATCSDETSLDCESAGGAWLGPRTICEDCPEPVGACCIPTGCAPDVGEAICTAGGGTWQGAGGDCSGCPPPLRLAVSKSAPSSVPEGGQLTYTLDYENVGGQIANLVSIIDAIPAGTTFVSATHGGAVTNGRVRWELGTLELGASGSVSFTVKVQCGQTQITNGDYRILSGFVYAQVGTPVVTNVTATGSDPVDILIESTPARDPLRRGDLIEHAITLTNTVAQDRAGINFNVDWGFASEFDSMIDDAGGTVEFQGVSSMRWTGSIAALGTVTVRFTTRIDACTTRPEERLNEGRDISVRNGCGVAVGSAAPPAAVPIERLTSVAMQLPAAGPPEKLFENPILVARAGTTEEVQIIITNEVNVPQTVSIVHTIPPQMIPAGDPPFVVPTDPGATYDAPSQTIRWSGTIPPLSEVLITYQAGLPTDACSLIVELSGDTGACVNDLFIYGTLLLVPDARTDAHLLQLTPFMGIRDANPPRSLLCIRPEIFFGMGRGPNADIFVAGVPSIQFNPETLFFDILDDENLDFAPTVLGLPVPVLVYDAAVDPRNGTALYIGTERGPIPRLGSIGRYDPATGAAGPVVQHEDLDGIDRIVVAADGTIGVVGARDTIIEIDPGAPLPLRKLTDPAFSRASCIALDANEDYIIVNEQTPMSLARVDRQTGLFDVLVPDVQTFLPFPTGEPFTSATVGDQGEVYLNTDSGAGLIVELGNPPTAQPLYLGQTSDLEFVHGANPCPRADGDGDCDVDAADYQLFKDCLQGPAGGLLPGCDGFDTDHDGDVDLHDAAVLMVEFGL